MKILHSADWHLGVKNLKLPSAQQQLMKDEMLMSVQDLFRKAYREDYDIILICGDLFHSKNISQKLLAIFFKEVENFARPVLYIEGNHDNNVLSSIITPKNFVFLNKTEYKFEYQGCVFYSYVPECAQLDNSKTNILLLHGNIENSKDNDYINLNDYLKYPFDYIALGHVHQFKKYKKDERIFAYSGSLLSNGFDECGDKGFLQLVIENNQVESLNFVPFSKRRYMISCCDITDLSDSKQIQKAIQDASRENDVAQSDLVRVVLTGVYDENAEKSVELIKQAFDEYFYFEIVDKSRLRIDIEKIKNERMSFKYEFISLVENSELSEEDKQKICEIGIEALKGEGLFL